MDYLRIEGDFPIFGKSAVTLGKFDGLHRGHRKLVQAATEEKKNGSSAVMTAFTLGEQFIFSREERRALAEEMGLDCLIECPLNERIRHMEPEAFVQEILVKRLHAACVIVGEDYRFGYQRTGTPGLLSVLGEKYGFLARIIPSEMEGNQKISSSLVKRELGRGNMEFTGKLLGTPFFLSGTVVHGRGLGHRALLPTTNLLPPAEKLMPPYGVYLTRNHFEEEIYYGITNVGVKPTVDGDALGVESYLYECSRDLYGRRSKVEFLHYLRPEKKFDSLDALKAQLCSDVEKGRELLQTRTNALLQSGGPADAETTSVPGR